MEEVFVDIYLARNLGDDLFLEILLQRFSETRFVVNYYGNDYQDFMKKHSNLVIPKYWPFFRLLNRAGIYDYINDVERISETYRACIFMGGSIFREEDWWYDVYEYRRRLVTAFKKKNKPVFILGANFGPFVSDKFRNHYRTLFEMCTDVCFRDQYSYRLFHDVASVRYEKDIVFQLELELCSVKKNIISISAIEPRHVPALINKRENYIKWLVEFVKNSVHAGFKVCLLSFCDVEGDQIVCNEIYNLLDEKEKVNCYVECYSGDWEKIIRIIDESRLLVASRFHANILGLLTGTNLFPLVYSDKTTHVLNDIDFAGMIGCIESCELISPEEILLQKCDMPEKYDLKQMKDSAKNQFSKLESWLKNEW